MAGLCLLFPCRYHQSHGHREVVSQAGQLGDKTEFFHLLVLGKELENILIRSRERVFCKGEFWGRE